MENKKFTKYIVEGLLIVFSVILALTFNKLFDNYKTEKKKSFAIESIKNELNQNSLILEKWNEKHIQINKRVTNIIRGNNDSLKTELLKYKFLNLGILTNNESLIDNMLTSTAWEASKSTGIISEFNFETTQKLTYVYSAQKTISEKTIEKILTFYFSIDSHKMEKIDEILIQYQLRFGELVGQENLLKQLYIDAIKQIEEEQ